MLITRVELQNIKSYRHAVIELHRGTTAIRGDNGAGKSTLVEAIGWALFDALPYSQGQFVREGERAGQVTVAFRSAEDEREYHVVRRAGSAPLWYVYDPELDHRPAEQKTDVLDFLRRHLQVEGEIALDALFNDALGVPQGALTADFLLTAANRKKKFDALLQVEDFSRAADKLRDTRTYLQEATHAQEAIIARLERETEQLDDWRADLTARRERERELGIHLAKTQEQLQAATVQRDKLLAREREVKTLESARDVARVAWEGAERAAEAARTQVAEAEQAARTCAGARADHETHERMEGELAEARNRVKVRDHRLKQRADLDRALEGAKRDAAHARTRLEEAAEAERRVVELAPRVTRQHTLMQRREALTRDVTRLEEARTTLGTREAEASHLAKEIAAAQARIAAVEGARPEAEQLRERRMRVEALQAALVTRTERQRRLKAIASELRGLASKRATAVENEAKAQTNLAKLEAARELAQRCPDLEVEQQRLLEEAARLRATIDHHRESRAQSAGGQCPFLREPCLNIQQRGLRSLDVYFDQLIQQDTDTLAPVQQRLARLGSELEQARKAAQYYARLDDYKEKHEQYTQQRAELDERVKSLQGESTSVEQSLVALGGEDELDEARAVLERSVAADRLLQELGPLRNALAANNRQRVAVDAELSRAREIVAALAGAPDELTQVDGMLAALGDPQSASAQAAGVARERPTIEAELARLESARAAAAARLAEADEALKPFEGLDAEVAALDGARKVAAAGHLRYLQHIQVAMRLTERQAALAAAERQARADAETHQRATEAHAQALARYDGRALDEATQRANELRDELSRATEELKHLQEQIAERSAAITRAEGFLDELAAARRERDTLTELFQMLDQFRTTIKEAGPYVMRALLRQISTEANRIFGEIMGDRSAQLAWEDDYEIVLHRSGQERSFAQLSGGEQMSAALAVRLALLRNLSRLDIAFFDEPTQNMDGERRTNLAEQIRRVHGFDQLVVISHDDTFEQGLDSVVHLEKRGGETVLVEEEALVGA
ncbi:MAG TPA: SMC family ATPase [Ktedonobacterales bacterium]